MDRKLTGPSGAAWTGPAAHPGAGGKKKGPDRRGPPVGASLKTKGYLGFLAVRLKEHPAADVRLPRPTRMGATGTLATYWKRTGGRGLTVGRRRSTARWQRGGRGSRPRPAAAPSPAAPIAAAARALLLRRCSLEWLDGGTSGQLCAGKRSAEVI
jgi:hypothetical protein